MFSFITHRRALCSLPLIVITIILFGAVLAHPLGNFTINHFVRIETGVERLRIRYVIDFAEVPTFQESQKADADGDGALSESERAAYLEKVTPDYVAGL